MNRLGYIERWLISYQSCQESAGKHAGTEMGRDCADGAVYALGQADRAAKAEQVRVRIAGHGTGVTAGVDAAGLVEVLMVGTDLTVAVDFAELVEVTS